MIIHLHNEAIKRVYQKYMKSLHISYTKHNDSKIVVENTLKYNKVTPIPYSVCVTFIEQIIFFLQLLHDENLTIIDFSPLYFELGYTSPQMKIQHGGENRIEMIQMDLSYNGDETLHLETTSHHVPFILLKETSLIVPINLDDDSLMLPTRQINMIQKHMLNTQNNIYNVFKFYDNNVLKNIQRFDESSSPSSPQPQIHMKECYISFSLMMFSFLFGSNVTHNINNIQEFMSIIRNVCNHTPLYYCIERMMHPNFNNRFLLLI